MYLLGIHDGHNASAALMKDGKIIDAIQEERFNKIKNFGGFPENSFKGVSHPYDLSCRPNVVNKDTNKDYYNLIKYYEELSSNSIILNTSFNLHGLPIVSEPKDAFHVLDNSGLKYLAIENYLVEKV